MKTLCCNRTPLCALMFIALLACAPALQAQGRRGARRNNVATAASSAPRDSDIARTQTNASTSAGYDHSTSAIRQTAENAPGVAAPTDNKTEVAKGDAAPSLSTATTDTIAPPPSSAKPQTTTVGPTNPAPPPESVADSPAPRVDGNAPPAATVNGEVRDELPNAARRSAPASPSQPPGAPVDKEEQRESAEISPAEKKRAGTGNRAEPLSASVNKSAQTSDDRAASSAGTASGAMAKEKPASRSAPALRGRAVTDIANESETDNALETRSAGGRRFRRQGNAWIDTAYNSSRATINVARGSEQYRALIADEPAIGNIANQLGGEVIIVWKGRAYRIH